MTQETDGDKRAKGRWERHGKRGLNYGIQGEEKKGGNREENEGREEANGKTSERNKTN